MSDKDILDCGDHSCEFAKDKSGQRTNGGCRCLQEVRDVQLRRKIQLYIAELKGELYQLKNSISDAEDEAAKLMLKICDEHACHAGTCLEEKYNIMQIYITRKHSLLRQVKKKEKKNAGPYCPYCAASYSCLFGGYACGTKHDGSNGWVQTKECKENSGC